MSKLRETIIDALFDAKISLCAERIEDGEKIMEFGLAGDDENVIEVKIVQGN